MDLSLDKLRELLEDFLSDTGGRRGRDREQQRQSAGAEAGGGGDAMEDMDLDDDFVMGGGGGGGGGDDMDDLGLDDDFVMGGGGGGGRPDSSDIDDDEVVDDLYHRIETLEDELDKNSSELGAIQDSQQHVSEQVEDVNDTVRQLVGVYDQLTDEVNPFTGEGETDEGFGVFGEQDDGFAEETAGGFSEPAEPETAASEGVTFSDLRNALDEGEEVTFEEGVDEDDDENDTRVEVQATDSVDDPDEEDEEDGDVTLDTLAETFATDIIVFEWLTHLVRTGGPAATLRAISYYYEIGWIEEDVKNQLEAVLSGPDLDIHVDPGATPDELSAEDHADSYTYIMKLQEIHETKQEVEA